MRPTEATGHVRNVAEAAKAFRAARLDGERLILDEQTRALLSGAVLLLAWVCIEEAPIPGPAG